MHLILQCKTPKTLITRWHKISVNKMAKKARKWYLSLCHSLNISWFARAVCSHNEEVKINMATVALEVSLGFSAIKVSKETQNICLRNLRNPFM